MEIAVGCPVVAGDQPGTSPYLYAECIVTGDKALLGLAPISNVRLVSPGDFMTQVLEATKK